MVNRSFNRRRAKCFLTNFFPRAYLVAFCLSVSSWTIRFLTWWTPKVFFKIFRTYHLDIPKRLAISEIVSGFLGPVHLAISLTWDFRSGLAFPCTGRFWVNPSVLGLPVFSAFEDASSTTNWQLDRILKASSTARCSSQKVVTRLRFIVNFEIHFTTKKVRSSTVTRLTDGWPCWRKVGGAIW